MWLTETNSFQTYAIALYIVMFLLMFFKKSFRAAYRRWFTREDRYGIEVFTHHPLFAAATLAFLVVIVLSAFDDKFG